MMGKSCKLVKDTKLSGLKTTIYQIFLQDENQTLLDKFIKENVSTFKSELLNITGRLKMIGHKVGAQDHFFTLGEGKLGDGVCALWDNPNKELRLYCIKFGSAIVVIGGGGPKPKSIRKFQESGKLKEENYFLRRLVEDIVEKLRDGDISYSVDGLNFEGNLNFNYDEE